ncbi:MAG TPA: Nramp family divalent metal transporter [Oligoflexia bacterium]|nr:Nramp family divalent metal transporter [Oligoflexia bacterium]HMR24583.1 Nramp family divalent metal transporter [Oligoflexia bacterium]
MNENSFRQWLSFIGPGIVLAATGIGSGDMIATAVGGANFGTSILWSVGLGVTLKFALNESMARFQLATGETILEAWMKYLHRSVSIIFLIYLLLWSFIVAAATISATGLAAHTLFPSLSVAQWAILHSIVAYVLVRVGSYYFLEQIMKILIAGMFVLIVYCAWSLGISWNTMQGFFPTLNAKHMISVFSIIGAVGGSVTLLSYSYWMQERKWQGIKYLSAVRLDLFVAYALTGCFCAAVVVIASRVDSSALQGGNIVILLAEQIQIASNPLGKKLFIWGFWAAVFSSVLGVWQGVPYIFENYLQFKYTKNNDNNAVQNYIKQHAYHIYLLYLAFPPLLLLLFNKPVWVVIIYTLVGALFMPFLAFSLFLLNNRKNLMQEARNKFISNFVLLFCLFIFIAMAVYEISKL